MQTICSALLVQRLLMIVILDIIKKVHPFFVLSLTSFSSRSSAFISSSFFGSASLSACRHMMDASDSTDAAACAYRCTVSPAPLLCFLIPLQSAHQKHALQLQQPRFARRGRQSSRYLHLLFNGVFDPVLDLVERQAQHFLDGIRHGRQWW